MRFISWNWEELSVFSIKFSRVCSVLSLPLAKSPWSKTFDQVVFVNLNYVNWHLYPAAMTMVNRASRFDSLVWILTPTSNLNWYYKLGFLSIPNYFFNLNRMSVSRIWISVQVTNCTGCPPKKCPPSHFSPQLCLRVEHEFEYIYVYVYGKLYYNFILCEYSMDLVQPIQMQQRVDDTW